MLKILHSQLTIKLSFFFECPMAMRIVTRTICSSSETSNKVTSIKALQQTIKSSRAKVIRIYKAGGTDCLMERMKTKTFIQRNYQLSPTIFMKLCYSQELSKKTCAFFSVRSCPGKDFWQWALVHSFMVSWSIACRMKFLCPISLTHVRKWKF